jgi:hypothetical protein
MRSHCTGPAQREHFALRSEMRLERQRRRPRRSKNPPTVRSRTGHQEAADCLECPPAAYPRLVGRYRFPEPRLRGSHSVLREIETWFQRRQSGYSESGTPNENPVCSGCADSNPAALSGGPGFGQRGAWRRRQTGQEKGLKCSSIHRTILRYVGVPARRRTRKAALATCTIRK